MSNYASLYWLTRLDALHSLFMSLWIVPLVASVLIYVVTAIASDDFDNEDDIKVWRKRANKLLFFMVLPFSVLVCFVPTKDEAILIIAGGKTMNYIQSDTSLNKIPAQTTTIISQYLDKTLKEMSKDK